jgi:hypothetical protein
MVAVIKFSEFNQIDLAYPANQSVGYGNGANWQGEYTLKWTTSSRPGTPYVGLLGFNTTINMYEYWDGTEWVTISTMVVDTGNALELSMLLMGG